MIRDSSDPMFEYADKMTPNFWYVSADKSVLQNGNKIYLEVVGDIPSGYNVGIMNNWAWKILRQPAKPSTARHTSLFQVCLHRNRSTNSLS